MNSLDFEVCLWWFGKEGDEL